LIVKTEPGQMQEITKYTQRYTYTERAREGDTHTQGERDTHTSVSSFDREGGARANAGNREIPTQTQTQTHAYREGERAPFPPLIVKTEQGQMQEMAKYTERHTDTQTHTSDTHTHTDRQRETHTSVSSLDSENGAGANAGDREIHRLVHRQSERGLLA